MVTYNQLNKAIQLYKPYIDQKYIKELYRLLDIYYNDLFGTTDKLAMFLANLVHEIDIKRNGTVRLRENLKYSCRRAKQIKGWKKRLAKASKQGIIWCKPNGYVKPKVLANIVYTNRLGNGPYKSKDGYFFRGLGSLQITGRDNFKLMFKWLKKLFGINLDFLLGQPELINSVFNNYTMNILSGFAFWEYSGMYKCNDINCTIDKINTYTKSRNSRIEAYKQIKEILNA